jgi:HPt (histidine-containing phosphotransfer) domain-containing protein
MNDHITKPIDVDLLFQVLSLWVDRPDDGQSGDGTVLPLPAVETSPPLPAHLPGIDLAAGLKRTLGNPDAYRRLLLKFCSSEKDFVERYRETGIEAAHRLAGVAGTLGAMDLYRAALALQDGGRSGLPEKDIEFLLFSVESALAEVLNGLEQIERRQQPRSATVLPLTEDQRRMAGLATFRLRELLRSGDTDSVTVADSLLELLADTPHRAQVEKLNGLVAGYDFEAALATTENLQALLETDPSMVEGSVA